MPKINDCECYLLQNAAIALDFSIKLGSSYVTGEKIKLPKRMPDLREICPPGHIGPTGHIDRAYKIKKLKHKAHKAFGEPLCPEEKKAKRRAKKKA